MVKCLTVVVRQGKICSLLSTLIVWTIANCLIDIVTQALSLFGITIGRLQLLFDCFSHLIFDVYQVRGD